MCDHFWAPTLWGPTLLKGDPESPESPERWFPEGGPRSRRLSHDSPRAETCTFHGSPPSKTPPRFNEKTPRETELEAKFRAVRRRVCLAQGPRESKTTTNRNHNNHNHTQQHTTGPNWIGQDWFWPKLANQDGQSGSPSFAPTLLTAPGWCVVTHLL